MADNVEVGNDGAAPDPIPVATDDVGGQHYQRVKLDLGADGSASPLVRGQQAKADSLPVTLASDESTVPVSDGGGSISVDDGGLPLAVDASGAAVPVTDNGASLTVDNAALSVTGPGTEAAALRVTVANDSTGIVSVDDNGATLSVDDGAGSLTVDNATISVVGSGTEATAQRVTIATDSTGVLSVDDNGSSLTVDDGAGSLTVDNAALSVVGTGTEATAQRVTIATDSTGVLSVDDNGGALTVDNGGTFAVQPGPTTAGGLSIFRSLDLDETEEDVKTSAGQVYGWYIANTATSTRFVKFYDATAANVTVGATAPVMTLPIPGNASDDVGANVLGGMGIAFATAICVAATTGVADADTGAPGANEVIVNIFYK